jgi:hypothetical protein
MKPSRYLSTLGILMITACTTAPSTVIIPRENQQYDTIGLGKNRVIALQKAMQGAEQYCKNQRSTPVVLNEQIKYHGVMSEQTGRIVEQVGAVVGAMTGVNSPQIARDDDYEVNIHFRCQS